MKIMLLGANGKVGTIIAKALSNSQHELVTVARKNLPDNEMKVPHYVVEDYQTTNWQHLLQNIDVLIVSIGWHANSPIPIDFAIIEGIVAKKIAVAVNNANRPIHVILLSSVKAKDAKFKTRLNDQIQKYRKYSNHKHQLETIWKETLTTPSPSLTILRLGSVYGGNAHLHRMDVIGTLEKAMRRRVIIPCKKTGARKKMLNATNMNDAISYIVKNPQAAHGMFELADGEPIETHELLQWISKKPNSKAVPISVPALIVDLLEICCRPLPYSSKLRRFFIWLTTDDGLVENNLSEQTNWIPRISTKDGICTKT